MWGVNGDDRIYGDAGNDYLYGGNDNDNMNGGLGADRLYGQNGNDTLDGGYDVNNYDWLYGGAGADNFRQNLKRINPNSYYYVSTAYLMDYASGDDTISYSYFG